VDSMTQVWQQWAHVDSTVVRLVVVNQEVHRSPSRIGPKIDFSTFTLLNKILPGPGCVCHSGPPNLQFRNIKGPPMSQKTTDKTLRNSLIHQLLEPGAAQTPFLNC
jgi:hypothetical protein